MEPPDHDEPTFDRRKIRAGLAMIVFVVIIALGLAIAVPNPIVKVFLAGVVVVAVLRMWRLRRIVESQSDI